MFCRSAIVSFLVAWHTEVHYPDLQVPALHARQTTDQLQLPARGHNQLLTGLLALVNAITLTLFLSKLRSYGQSVSGRYDLLAT